MKLTIQHAKLNHAKQRLASDFQLSIIVILTGFVVLVIGPFTIFRLLRAEYLIFALDLCMVLFTLGVAYYAWCTNQVAKAAIILATCISFGMVGTAFTNPTVAPYWVYSMALFSFALVSPRHAAFLITMGFTSVMAQPDAFASTAHKASFAATLPATSIFAYIFAKRNAYQRQQLESIALTDVLTNTGNRRAFSQALEQELNKHHTPPGPALALFDVDHFKRINDDFGHEAGDEVLKSIVQEVTKASRDKDHLFRVGGEEFCIIIKNADKTDAVEFMNRLREQLANSRLLPSRVVTVSIGVTHLREEDTAETALKRADDALYKAKGSGRNCVVYH